MKKKYPAPTPNKCKIFVETWNDLIPGVMEKTKDEKSSIKLLEILCNLFVDYQEVNEEIKDFIPELRFRTDEYVHKSFQKLIDHKHKLLRDIRAFSRKLEIVNEDRLKVKGYDYYWNLLKGKVEERKNFHDSHLEQLKILCNLYVDLEEFTRILDEEGHTYESDGRYGFKVVERPEAKMKLNAIKEIRSYNKLLGLVLVKDETTRQDGNEDEWD